MECINLNNSVNVIHNISMSFILKLTYLQEIWLFNTFDGCQHIILQQGIKINQISKIIIIDLNIDKIAGLLGILSSLSLINRSKPLHIYGPVGLIEYLDLSKKYSHTNFCYSIYLHILIPGLIVDHFNYQVYIMMKYNSFDLLVYGRSQPGKFNIVKAKKFNILSGPLYGKLKQNLYFLLPDGFILDGSNFINDNHIGAKYNIFKNIYHTRQFFENTIKSNILIYSL